MSVLIAGIGRSGTSAMFEMLAAAFLRKDASTECVYEPLLWSIDTARKSGRVKGSLFSTENLNPLGVYTHCATPMFTDHADDVLKFWCDAVFGGRADPPTRVVKEIRASGRLVAVMAERPEIRCIMLTRNPLDTLNSSLGMFSFFGEEFHPSDRPRFVREIEAREGPQVWPAANDFASWTELYVRKFTEAGLQAASAMPERMLVMPYEAYSKDKLTALRTVYAFLGLGDFGPEVDHVDRMAGPVTTVRNLSLVEVETLDAATRRYCSLMKEFDHAGALTDEFCDQLVEKYRAMKPRPPLVQAASMNKTTLQWRLSVADQASRSGPREDRKSIEGRSSDYYRDWISRGAREGRIAAPLSVASVSRDRPLVTCVISAFNAEKTLEACVNSVMGQTLPYDAVIIADDHSSDRTQELALALGGRYTRLSYQRRSANVGPSANRDLAIRSADGGLVTQIDADDWFHPTKNEMECLALKNVMQDVAFSNIEMLTQDGIKHLITSDYDKKSGGQAFEAIITRRWPVPRDMLISQELYLKSGGYEYAVLMFEDWRLKLRICYAMAGRWRFAGGLSGTTYDRRLPGLSSGSPIKQVYWQLDAVASVADLVPDTEPALALACCNLVKELRGKFNGLPERFLSHFADVPGGFVLRRALKVFHARIRFSPKEEDMFRSVYAFLHAATDSPAPVGYELQHEAEALIDG